MIKKYSLKSLTKKKYFGFILLLAFVVMIVVGEEFSMNSILFGVIVLGIAILLNLDKQNISFYDNKIVSINQKTNNSNEF